MLIILVFILGFAIGMLIHACILSYRMEKYIEIEYKGHKEHKEDPADWWKHGKKEDDDFYQ